MLDVTLYSTHCPKCRVLENKLKEKNINYEEVNDVTIMQALGFEFIPKLKVNDKIYDFKEAMEWIGEQ